MKNTGLQVFNRYLTNETTQDYLLQVLGSKKESFVTNCISLVSNNVSLQDCSPNTIMYSAIKATSLGLPLDNNLGFAYVLPYKNTKKDIQEAQFQIGYKGFIQLAMRSGQFKTINVSNVKDGEISNINRLTGEINFNWLNEQGRESKKDIGFVAFFRLGNGFEKSLYMTIKDLETHGKKYSKSYNSAYSNWKKMFESMASKTVLKLLLSKYAPLSIQLQAAVKFDQAVIKDEENFTYVDAEQQESIDPLKIAEQKEYKRVTDHINSSDTIKKLEMVKDFLKDEEHENLYILREVEINDS